jgi:hypothetical protein
MSMDIDLKSIYIRETKMPAFGQIVICGGVALTYTEKYVEWLENKLKDFLDD